MSVDDSDVRPSMQQDWHPDHNMPEPEHDGTQLAGTFSSFINALPSNHPAFKDQEYPKPRKPTVQPTLKERPTPTGTSDK